MESLLEPILSADAPKPIGPYSQGVRSRDFLFCSGQIGIDPATGALVEGTIEKEAEQVMRNLWAVLHQAGATFAHVVRTTIYLTDMADFTTVNHVYETALGTARPARSTVQVVALPRSARLEIECTASLP